MLTASMWQVWQVYVKIKHYRKIFLQSLITWATAALEATIVIQETFQVQQKIKINNK